MGRPGYRGYVRSSGLQLHVDHNHLGFFCPHGLLYYFQEVTCSSLINIKTIKGRESTVKLCVCVCGGGGGSSGVLAHSHPRGSGGMVP